MSEPLKIDWDKLFGPRGYFWIGSVRDGIHVLGFTCIKETTTWTANLGMMAADRRHIGPQSRVIGHGATAEAAKAVCQAWLVDFAKRILEGAGE